MRRLAVIACLALAACNCEPPRACENGGCLLVAKGEDAGVLENCVTGAWRSYGGGGACAPIPCRPDAGPPECGRADCSKYAYSVYLPDVDGGSAGTVFQSSFILSASAQTWSAVIPPDRYAYVAAQGTLFTDGGSGPRQIDATCTAQQLVIGGAALKIRSSPAEAAALEVLMRDSGVWSGLPAP
jgi:hypothetical protein